MNSMDIYGMVVVRDKLAAIQQLFGPQKDRQQNQQTNEAGVKPWLLRKPGVDNSNSIGSTVKRLSGRHQFPAALEVLLLLTAQPRSTQRRPCFESNWELPI
jgi:hypothetical protein